MIIYNDNDNWKRCENLRNGSGMGNKTNFEVVNIIIIGCGF